MAESFAGTIKQLCLSALSLSGVKSSLVGWTAVEINHPMTIGQFVGDYEFLSNFYPVSIEHKGMVFMSLEHAYQAAKTRRVAERRWIADSMSPGQAKKRGHMVGLRPDWEQIKVQVMEELLAIKFSNPMLRRKLLLTKNAHLIEGNHHKDTFWGRVGVVGENHLGRLLMKLRGKLKQQLRVIVAGSRPPQAVRADVKLREQWYMRHAMDVPQAVAEFEKAHAVKVGTVISGGAQGYDQLGERFSREYMQQEPEVYRADWDKHGRIAGIMRNQQMIDDGRADGLVACWDRRSPGTKDMIDRAKQAQLYLHIHYVQP